MKYSVGIKILGIFLIIYALQVFGVVFNGLSLVMGILALISGILLLVGR